MGAKDTAKAAALSLVLGVMMAMALNREETASWSFVQESRLGLLLVYLAVLLLLAWLIVLNGWIPRWKGMGKPEEWVVNSSGVETKRFVPSNYRGYTLVGNSGGTRTYMNDAGLIMMTTMVRPGRKNGAGGDAMAWKAVECFLFCLMAALVFVMVTRVLPSDSPLSDRLATQLASSGRGLQRLWDRLGAGGTRLVLRLKDLFAQLSQSFQTVISRW